MDHCIFCEIAAHRAPAAVIMEDAETLAFLDIHPLTRGHTLVIPREHVATLFELSPTAGEAVMRATIKVARALRE